MKPNVKWMRIELKTKTNLYPRVLFLFMTQEHTRACTNTTFYSLKGIIHNMINNALNWKRRIIFLVLNYNLMRPMWDIEYFSK